MKYKIVIKKTESWQYYFHLVDVDYSAYEVSIPSILDMEYIEYENLILQYCGFEVSGNYRFKTEVELKKFIEEVVEPRLVMVSLCNEI